MKTIDEMIEVMKAYKDRKEIEVKDGDDNSWFDVQFPSWDWLHKDYRIKPEKPQKKIISYGSADEFLAAQKEHGPYLMPKGCEDYFYMPIAVGKFEVDILDDKAYKYEELTKKFTWQDGTPCGKEVANDK